MSDLRFRSRSMMCRQSCAATRSIAALGIAALVLVGCSTSSSTSPTTSPSPDPTGTVVNTCAGTGTGWRPVPKVDLDAAQLGSGPTVVFADDSGNSACDWLPLARQLATAGFRAVLFSYADFDESQSAADMITLAGSTHYVLVGASLGGRPNELLELAGVAHGTELLTLTASDGTPLTTRILAFIRARLQ